MSQAEKTVLLILTLLLGLLSFWLQYVFFAERESTIASTDRNEPDYYIENFTALGMDEVGKRRYVLEAERMAHYPQDDTALLDNPHVIQYFDDGPPRHTYSDSAWVSSGGDEVLLTGNVRVIQSHQAGSDSTGGVTTSDKMRIRLKQKLSSDALK